MDDLQMPEAILDEHQPESMDSARFTRRTFNSPIPELNTGTNGQFDILDWHPAYQSCQKYFLDHAQYDTSVQAVAALVNINLPHQWLPKPIKSFNPEQESFGEASRPSRSTTETQPSSLDANRSYTSSRPQNLPSPPPYLTIATASRNLVSLVPFIRRLVVTGFDRGPVLHGFFGDDWRKGIGPLHECERRNYLFAAKSGGWAKVKTQYDMGPQETVPFLQPPQNIQLVEIENAERLWSQWLAVEDWMIGPRAPENLEDYVRSSQGSHGNV